MSEILLVFLTFQLQGLVGSGPWVSQWPLELKGVVGGNATLRCRIHPDAGQHISRCNAFWYLQDSRGRWQEVEQSPRHAGRLGKSRDSATTAAALILAPLQPNDTDVYYCTQSCRVDGRMLQYHGNGTLLVVRAEAEDCAGCASVPVPLYTLLSAKAVLAGVTASVLGAGASRS